MNKVSINDFTAGDKLLPVRIMSNHFKKGVLYTVLNDAKGNYLLTGRYTHRNTLTTFTVMPNDVVEPSMLKEFNKQVEKDFLRDNPNINPHMGDPDDPSTWNVEPKEEVSLYDLVHKNIQRELEEDPSYDNIARAMEWIHANGIKPVVERSMCMPKTFKALYGGTELTKMTQGKCTCGKGNCDKGTGNAGDQVGGNHYGEGTDVFDFSLEREHDCLQHSVIKYVDRHKLKNGEQDIRKAISVLERILQEQYNG